jgi:hypothetical protein
MNRCLRYAVLTTLFLLPAAGAWADKATTIWFTANEDTSNPVACTASTVKKTQPIRRNEPITWKLKSDSDYKCPGFDPTKVQLRFQTDVVGAGGGRVVHGQANGKAKATVTKDPALSPDGRHTYKVYYGDYLAEDPELDVKGDMPLPGGPKKVKK